MKLHPQFVIDPKGRRTGVLLTPDEYQRLLKVLDDQLDATDLDEVTRQETSLVPYEQAREELRVEGKL